MAEGLVCVCMHTARVVCVCLHTYGTWVCVWATGWASCEPDSRFTLLYRQNNTINTKYKSCEAVL